MPKGNRWTNRRAYPLVRSAYEELAKKGKGADDEDIIFDVVFGDRIFQGDTRALRPCNVPMSGSGVGEGSYILHPSYAKKGQTIHHEGRDWKVLVSGHEPAIDVSGSIAVLLLVAVPDVWPRDTEYVREWYVQRAIEALSVRGASRSELGDTYICRILIGDELSPEASTEVIPHTTASEDGRTILHPSRLSRYQEGIFTYQGDDPRLWEVLVSDYGRCTHRPGFIAVLLLRRIPPNTPPRFI